MNDPNPDRVNILLVDDKPEKVLALGAVLESLGQTIVPAHSGKAALRCLLEQEFAVILLDVDMPGMDGFETAALIRQRQRLEHIPIIFITAYGDEMLVSRGYSLGAVDYILTPVIPEVLRTKVSVFIELAKMNAQIRRQAQWLEQRATQLNRLSVASLAIHDALSIERLLQLLADAARELAGAHQGYASAVTDLARSQTRAAASFSDAYHQWRGGATHPGLAGLAALTPTVGRALRLSDEELRRHPAYPNHGDRQGLPPLHGLLAASLVGRDGHEIGLIQVSHRQEGNFTQDDEVVLVQLAQIASIAIENALFAGAREANRLKDEFLATLSHELRTPLNAILGWTRLLRTEEFPPAGVAHGLDVIERNVKAQTKLIEDLLDVSRITTGKATLNLRPVALGAVVSAAIDAIRPAAEAKRVSIDASFSARDDQTNADADRLQQVVGNLLGNAVKFTPEGGRIAVEVTRDGGVLRTTVSDSGIGIKPEFLPYVFDRFRQADATSTRSHGGLGIGLTIVRHFIELHGGRVTATSAGEGQGATFTLTLPVAPISASAREGDSQGKTLVAAADPETLENLAGLRVLVVDDAPDARDLIARVFKRCNAAVVVAQSADEALREFRRVVPDVLVSDLAMPGKDGTVLITEIRRLPPHEGGDVPALALTAFAREEDRARCLAAGFQVHASKPIDPAALVAQVARLLGRARSSTQSGREAPAPAGAPDSDDGDQRSPRGSNRGADPGAGRGNGQGAGEETPESPGGAPLAEPAEPVTRDAAGPHLLTSQESAAGPA